ncbi:MAG: hypothetical protein V7637_3883 [Mycobacteriales bacterium]
MRIRWATVARVIPGPNGTRRSGTGRTGQGRTGQGRTGQGRTGQGRTGQGRTGRGRTGQGRTGWGRFGWVTAAAGVFLAVAWLAAPPGVPLYDGIGFPDEPYRFVSPPAGATHTAPPTTAHGQVRAARGASAAPVEINSDEVAPQVDITLQAGALRGDPRTTRFQISASPVAGTQTGGSAPRLDGNIYRLAATVSPAGPATLLADRAGYIAMRLTTSRRDPIFVYRPSPAAGWRTLPTEQIGLDVYEARLAGTGDYALSYSPRAITQFATKHRGLLLLGGLVLILALAILAVRLTRSRRAGAGAPEPEPKP